MGTFLGACSGFLRGLPFPSSPTSFRLSMWVGVFDPPNEGFVGSETWIFFAVGRSDLFLYRLHRSVPIKVGKQLNCHN